MSLLRYSIKDILGKRAIGQPAIITGWVKKFRAQKQNVFVDVSDGSCPENLQIYLPRSEKPDNLSFGSSIRAEGIISETPRGQLELSAKNIKVIGNCEANTGFPFVSGQNYTPEYIRQYIHFRPRTDYIASILRIRNIASLAVHNYFNNQNFLSINVPILTSNDCEGAGEIFRIEPECEEVLKAMKKKGQSNHEAYFGKKTFLTVSGQLHLEAAAHGLGNVYTFGPTFRAENSKSRLHLSEFYMIEAEMAFVDDLKEISKIIEGLVKSVVVEIQTKCESDLKNLKGDDFRINWPDKEFKCITYDEAFDILSKDSFDVPLKKGEALGKEHELALVSKMNDTPTFVINWPKEIKPFYMRDCSDDNSKVAALDLLSPITGEIAGGSLRENDYEKLKSKLPSPSLEWYLELRKFGGVPTGGFGIGFERLLQTICGVSNIKDTIPFPRWPHNCSL